VSLFGSVVSNGPADQAGEDDLFVVKRYPAGGIRKVGRVPCLNQPAGQNVMFSCEPPVHAWNPLSLVLP